jgi:uncharacterized ParB-like nuclease family protein
VTTQEQAPQLLDVNSIEHSPRVKVRLGMHAATVARYAEAFESGAIMDPIDVFREKGTDRFVLADGSHRLAAAHRTQRKTIATVVHEGDETDALKFALRCNAKHGLLRRDSDVQVCIRSLMLNASLTNKYKTHQERAELLGMSYGSYQRHFAKYRTSSGGSDEEKDEKTRLQQKAAKKARPQTRSGSRSQKRSRRRVSRPLPLRLQFATAPSKEGCGRRNGGGRIEEADRESTEGRHHARRSPRAAARVRDARVLRARSRGSRRRLWNPSKEHRARARLRSQR